MKNNCQKNKNSGFTLIELLIVIAVMGILSAFVIQSSSGATQRARDSRRKSDLNQYRIALENYSLKRNGVYPSFTTAIDVSGTFCSTTLGTTYLASCLQDPSQSLDATYYYRYQSDGTGGGSVSATQYILWSKLERVGNGGGYWFVCANGKSAEKSTIPVVTGDSTGDCGF